MCIIRKDLNFKVKREKANSTDLHKDNNMIMKKNTLAKKKDENYTSVSSVNIDELVHLLRKENPEVARDLIAQMPEMQIPLEWYADSDIAVSCSASNGKK